MFSIYDLDGRKLITLDGTLGTLNDQNIETQQKT